MSHKTPVKSEDFSVSCLLIGGETDSQLEELHFNDTLQSLMLSPSQFYVKKNCEFCVTPKLSSRHSGSGGSVCLPDKIHEPDG